MTETDKTAAAAHVRLQPLNFAPEHHPSRFRGARDSRVHRVSPLGLPGLTGVTEVDGVDSTPVFHTQGPNSFPSPYAGPPPSHGLFRGLGHAQNVNTDLQQHRHLRPPLPPPPQAHERHGRPLLTASPDMYGLAWHPQPLSQRVWIALEAKGLEYQYCEIYPLRKPKPTALLEANRRGLVPAILQEN